ncbi:DUF7768 domain-containing protein [[Ruminococcus] torques]|uniref:DUF7768 domain-containing protein n=1 Tax=[Ruminococcus] torques TaxID=33039 RepID=UPI003AB5B353
MSTISCWKAFLFMLENGFMVLLGKCDELWVFGEEASAGMCAEIAKAKRHGKKIRYFDSSCNETNRALEIGPERLQEER